jgi:hypothetical protein
MSCGIDAKEWKESLKKKKKDDDEMDETERAVNSKSKKSSRSLEGDDAGKKSGGGGVFTAVVIVLLLSILVQVFHLCISAPIKPGHVVSPGIWLSKCGVFGISPSCDNAYLHIDRSGKVSLYRNRELAWQINGGNCTSVSGRGGNATAVADCTPGLQFKDNKAIVVGGKPINSISFYQSSSNNADLLSPWPFAEQPNVRIVVRK